MILVVDFIEILLFVKDFYIGVGEGKELERRKVFFDVLNLVFLKVNGEEVVVKVECSRGCIEIVIEFLLKYCFFVELILEVLCVLIIEVEEYVLLMVEDSEDEVSMFLVDYRKVYFEGNYVEKILFDWFFGILCDLCERGLFFFLGVWYFWCCGNFLLGCFCIFEGR